MELSPSRVAASWTANQELPRILWKPKVYYRVHKSPPLVLYPETDQSSLYYPISPKSTLILSTHFRICLPSGPFPHGFPTKNL
jgi:hypothetical protein